MPSLLARLRKSPHSSPARERSSSSSSLPSLTGDSPPLPSSIPKSASVGSNGSLFVERVNNAVTPASKRNSFSTPNNKDKPSPLDLPATEPTKGHPLGTPRLVLTEEGSNSPVSFKSSPKLDSSPGEPGVGLGIGVKLENIACEDDEEEETPRSEIFNQASMPDFLSEPVSSGREPSSSIKSGGSSIGGHPRHGSVVQRVSEKLNLPSPATATQSLYPTNARNGSKSKSSKGKKSRRNSTSSHGVAALARGGLYIAGPHGGAPDDALSTISSRRAVSVGRSPYLVRPRSAKEGDEGASFGVTDYDDTGYEDEDGSEEDESDVDALGGLPVTGFAVASNRRNADFHLLFPLVDEGDYLIDDYGCALAKDILIQGRLYVSENHICFHANILGWVTDVVIPFSEIKLIEKKMTALVIPNAIGVATSKEKHTFASLISRDSTYDVMMNVWRLVNPEAAMFPQTQAIHSRPPSIVEEEAGENGTSQKKGQVGKKTQCPCGKHNKHFTETALETTFPSTPEKVYNLMFNSGWYKSFLSDDQKLKDIESSDWRPDPDASGHLTRSISYIKPLNGSIGPKQTKCHIIDEQEHCDYEDYISMITTTRTPDVPSGGVFSVKTRTCLMWAGANSTKVVVTTQVDWTGKSWVKGIIEKSAIDGQKSYHDDLAKGMRAYMREHATEFAGADGVLEEEGKDEVTVEDQSLAPTEAQEYAAKTRQQRQDEDLSHLQGALDSVMSGLKSILTGLKVATDTVGNLLGDIPISKETMMGIVILLLVFSNIYTYFSSKPSASVRQARRIRRLGVDPEVERAVRAVLAERRESPADEIAELLSMLDEIDSRVQGLRRSLTEVKATPESMNDLD